MRLFLGDELGRPFFHDDEGKLVSVVGEGVWGVAGRVDDVQDG